MYPDQIAFLKDRIFNLGISRSQADDITVVKAAVYKMTMIDGTIFKRTILEAAVNEFAIFFCNTLVFLVFYEPFLIAGYLHISVPPPSTALYYKTSRGIIRVNILFNLNIIMTQKGGAGNDYNLLY